MDARDKARFTILMNAIGEATPKGMPSPEKTKLYFDALKDMSYELIEQRMTNHLRFNKWFPAICEIRQEADPEIQAQNDIDLIEDLCMEFIFPDFPQTGREILHMKLKDLGRDDLTEMVDRWGAKIVNGLNPSATRAQMIRGHKARIEHDMIEGMIVKKLNSKTEKLIAPLIEKS